MTNGEERQMLLALTTDETRIVLDVDPFNHPAWQSGSEKTLIDTSGQVARFKNKYGDLF